MKNVFLRYLAIISCLGTMILLTHCNADSKLFLTNDDNGDDRKEQYNKEQVNPNTQEQEEQNEEIKQFILIRHGISDFKLEMIVDGPQDLLLNNKGESHIQSVANLLQKKNITPSQIITSPLKRCVQTSEIIARMFGLDGKNSIKEEKNLREIYRGDWSQEPHKSAFLEILRQEGKDNIWEKQAKLEQELGAPKDADDWKIFKDSIIEEISGIFQQQPNNTVVVSHGVVIKEYLKGKGYGEIAKQWKNQGDNRSPLIVTVNPDGSIKEVSILSYE